MPNKKRNLLSLLLALSLLAGCAAGPESSTSPEPPPESVSQPAPESQSESSASTEPEPEPELPDSLAGARLYYTPGHRLTLYAMEPETGTIRTVREEDFWNGREVESVSPSGNRVLLSSWDGAPGRRVVALSLYDIEKDLLVNLERTIEDSYENWEENHWFPGYAAGYCFVDENTFCYTRLCFDETPEKGHLHFYDIGEDGQVTARFWSPEYPDPVEEEPHWWLPDCRVLPEEGVILCRFPTAEKGWEWLTWDAGTGKLLSRMPAENGNGGLYRDGIFYYIDQDREKASETFRLAAYHMETDTVEFLADGTIPKTPGMENDPIDARGVLERVRVEDVRDGKVLLRSSGEEYGYDAPSLYREFLWEPSAGKEIRFGEPLAASSFPVNSALGYVPIFTVSPAGEGLYLPVPQEMAARYQEWDSGRPYPLSFLPSGELLFLAKEPVETLPQEDPEKRGELAGAEGSTGGHRLSLYRFSPESGQTALVRYPGFWNGLEVEDVSPSGNRLLLATRDEGGQAALSVYNIRENLLTNLTYEKNFDGTKWEYQHWFPGKYRYRFVSEDAFLYEELTYDTTAKQYYLPRWCSTEYGLNGWKEWVVHPQLPEHPNLPCVYLPEEQTILCDLPLKGGTQRFTWQVDVEALNNNGGRKNNLLSQVPAEDAPPLEQYRPRPQGASDLPLPKRMGPVWPLISLPTGETLFLAQ